ncbi:MAG TPA: peptide chain release factor 2 [Candidatus Krumholzibacteria bacterium]|nr:peptide chain release factor 2 [Candidatus Krumholzibacteria bacterium]
MKAVHEVVDQLNALQERARKLKSVFDAPALEKRLEFLTAQMNDPDFWSNKKVSDEAVREAKGIRARLEPVQSLVTRLADAGELLGLAREEDDASVLADVAKELDAVEPLVAEQETATLLSGPDDHRDAIVTIHSGAGGTESMDWAEMLLRMYTRFCERHGFTVGILDMTPGEEAGVKGVSLEINGDFAFGRLKAESGVHRLVRLSPYDAAHRRQTSFASVFVYPEIDEEIEVEINPDDLRIDTYRASGAGGQHVNKTDSAVRITHLPTNIVVQCQNERSQQRNRESAMKILRARLYALKQEEEKARIDKMMEVQKEIAWGSQIRSYVLHPYTMVKDHRTDWQSSDTQSVLDGDLDGLIEAYLHKFAD